MANGKNDLRLHVGWVKHYKTRRLRKLLGADGPMSLLALWSYAAEHRRDGRLVGMDIMAIEAAADWDGPPGALHAALVECRWLEPDGVSLHDWVPEQPWITEAEERSEAARVNGAKGGRASAAARAAAGGEVRGSDGRFTEAKPKLPASEELKPTEPPFLSSPILSLPQQQQQPAPPPPREDPPTRAPDEASTPGGLALELAGRIRWPRISTVEKALDELRGEGWAPDELRARIEATPTERRRPFEWAEEARKARATTPRPSDTEKRAAARSATRWLVRYAQAGEDVERARGALAQAQAFALASGRPLAELAAEADVSLPPSLEPTRQPATMHR